MTAYCAGLLFLAALAAEDIRKKRISVWKVLFFAFGAVFYKVFTNQFLWNQIINCLIPGGLLLLLSLLTRESIGYGDGMAVLVLGLWTSEWFVASAAGIGIMLSGIFASVCLLFQKKDPIPFIPFLLLGMEVTLAYA